MWDLEGSSKVPRVHTNPHANEAFFLQSLASLFWSKQRTLPETDQLENIDYSLITILYDSGRRTCFNFTTEDMEIHPDSGVIGLSALWYGQTWSQSKLVYRGRNHSSIRLLLWLHHCLASSIVIVGFDSLFGLRCLWRFPERRCLGTDFHQSSLPYHLSAICMLLRSLAQILRNRQNG